MNFLHAEPERRSRRGPWEVSIAATKEHFVELRCTPPPQDRPHPEGVLDEDVGGVQPLRPHRRQMEGWHVVYCILLGSGLAFALGFGGFCVEWEVFK
jgi:hypothetical protein